MSLRPYKFVVQAVAQIAGDDGTVEGEQTTEPVVLFGCDALAKWAADFPSLLDTASRSPEDSQR